MSTTSDQLHYAGTTGGTLQAILCILFVQQLHLLLHYFHIVESQYSIAFTRKCQLLYKHDKKLIYKDLYNLATYLPH